MKLAETIYAHNLLNLKFECEEGELALMAMRALKAASIFREVENESRYEPPEGPALTDSNTGRTQ